MTEKDNNQQTPDIISHKSDPPKTTDAEPADGSREQPVSQFFGWKGPLPPPQALRAFDDVVDNGAERVFGQFEDEGAHRRKMERLHLTAQVQDMRLGKILAFIFVMSMIGICAYAIYAGYPALAGVLGGGVLSSVVWAFVRVASDENAEAEKQKKNT